jgi:hypothetical protein
MQLLPTTLNVVLALSAVMHISKAIIELATGADLGLLALLANSLLIVGLFVFASRFWRGAPMIQAQLAS